MNKSFLALLLVRFPSLAVTVAQVELPAEFADNSKRIAVTGFGGHNRGEFQFAEFHGKFARDESRLSLMNSTYVSNKRASSFVLTNSDLELTDVNPTMFIAVGIDAKLRRSAVVSALALMVLRDPVNSALED